MKKMILTLAIALAVAAPATVFAATATQPAQPAPNSQAVQTCPYGYNGTGYYANLTDEQKQDLEEAFDNMLDTKRDIIEDLVASGTLTEAQGDLALERLDRMEAYHDEYGYFGMGRMMRFSADGATAPNGAACGFGNGRGFGNGGGFGNGRMMQGL